MRFCRLSLRHEGVLGIGRLAVSLFRQCIISCLDWMKNRISSNVWRNCKCARYILELPCQRAQTKPLGFSFFILLLLFSCFSLTMSLLVLYLFFILWNTKKKHLKCKRIFEVLTWFYFPLAGWPTSRLGECKISFFTHKYKIIPNWTRKTVWLLINNINVQIIALRKSGKIFLEAIFSHSR